jgi:hypothetical protein
VLRHLHASQVVRLIRKWPRYRYSEDLGQDLWPNAGEMLASAYEEHEARDSLVLDLLVSLSDEAISELLVLMYVGRDHKNDPLSLTRWERYFLARRHNRDQSLRTMAEKVDAPKYLAWGLRAIGAYPLKLGVGVNRR